MDNNVTISEPRLTITDDFIITTTTITIKKKHDNNFNGRRNVINAIPKHGV